MILTPNITLASPMSFMSNFDERKLLVSITILLQVPKMSIPSTYKEIITHSPSMVFAYTHLLTSREQKSSLIKTLLNFSYHCLGACFKPYKDLINLHTFFSCPLTTQPSGCTM